ncbi:hypothetical protein [Mucilaginibacter sp.]|uniref:hypothetical protein n=1 Tax=Mucilaginibacter sp. TaxID=1882438 RepID=UPI0032670AE8
MKLASFLLVMIIVLLSAAPEHLYASKNQYKTACCAKGSTTPTSSHGQKKGCGTEACSNLLLCSNCGFLVGNAVSTKADVPTLKKLAFAPYTTPGISGFSVSSWNPPKA